jgi:hypothetical protein
MPGGSAAYASKEAAEPPSMHSQAEPGNEKLSEFAPILMAIDSSRSYTDENNYYSKAEIMPRF